MTTRTCRFKKGDVIQCQIAGATDHIYKIISITSKLYTLKKFNSKERSFEIGRKYIDGGVYLDQVYTYNYILYNKNSWPDINRLEALN